MTMQPVVIVDANNIMHRDFHGCPPAMKAGHNVNAVRALARRVEDWRTRFQPVCITAVFDAGTSGRELLCPEYKAHRDGTPPELGYQFDLAQRYLPSHFGCDVLCVQGYEADDVIAALVGPARAAGHAVIVVSNDKDLSALVDDVAPAVALYRKDKDHWTLCGARGVEERLGVPPRLVLDCLALCGDRTDGIAGVPGIGPKSAALMLSHGSLDELLAKPEVVTRERWRQLLVGHREQVLRARRLVAPVAIPLAVMAAALRPAQGTRAMPAIDPQRPEVSRG